MAWKRHPFKVVLSFGNMKRSAAAKSGEELMWHNGCLMVCQITADEERSGSFGLPEDGAHTAPKHVAATLIF
jgi:hypothetical protein